MEETLKIIAVSYLNTLPFIHGINNSGVLKKCDLVMDNPGQCVKNALQSKGDIALIPVASLHQFPNAKIITDFCLGANKQVCSVSLLSKKPLNEITSIDLDFHSRTSVKLIKVLAENHWKIKNIKWNNIDTTKEENINKTDSVLLIGDKVFKNKDKFEYCYDLSEEWHSFIGLPFVFACWIQLNPNLNQKLLSNFNNALKWGIERREELVDIIQNDYPNIDVKNYLCNCIDYSFNNEKRKGMNEFLRFAVNF